MSNLPKIPHGWTEEREKLALSLYNQGVISRNIAEALNNHIGYPAFTRRAVLGKIHRLGLTHKKRARLKRQMDQFKALFTDGPQPKSCQWPIGHPHEKGFHFCGEKAKAGKPYCPTHCDVAFVKRKTEEAA